jgi:hypothetical protein
LVTNISCFIGLYPVRKVEGAPSLRFLQEPALSLSKGWIAMLRVLFDLLWTPDQIHLVLAFPTPALRKEREGQGTN